MLPIPIYPFMHFKYVFNKNIVSNIIYSIMLNIFKVRERKRETDREMF